MTPRESQCLLITGWARREADQWTLLDPDGTGSKWIDATPDEIAELEAALVEWPKVENIWTGLMDFGTAHRANCPALKRLPCHCDHGNKPPTPEAGMRDDERPS